MPSSRSRRRLSRLETYASRFSKGKYMQVPVNDQLTSRVICRTTSGPPRASPAGLTTNGTLRGRGLQYAAGAFCPMHSSPSEYRNQDSESVNILLHSSHRINVQGAQTAPLHLPFLHPNLEPSPRFEVVPASDWQRFQKWKLITSHPILPPVGAHIQVNRACGTDVNWNRR